MTARERAEAMIELVERQEGYQSMRFRGQGPLLWHSGDKELMVERREAMIASVAEAIEAAAAEEREACAKLIEGFCLDDVVPAEPEHLKQAASYLAAAIRARKQ